MAHAQWKIKCKHMFSLRLAHQFLLSEVDLLKVKRTCELLVGIGDFWPLDGKPLSRCLVIVSIRVDF